MRPLLITFAFLILLTSCHNNIHLKSGEEIDLTCYNNVPFDYLETIFEHIQPDSTIEYWEFRQRGFYDSCIIICSGGDYTKAFKTSEVKETWGFYASQGVYYYLVFVKNDSVFTCTSRNGLLNFMGKIDNIYEALYIINKNGFYAHPYDKKVGLYKLTNDGYNILGIKTISDCPINQDRYFLKVSFDGTLYSEYIDKYYYNKNECIIE